MAPKSKKTSYVLSSNTFNLTRWSRAIRLLEPPSLIYQPKDHLLANAQAKLVSFSFFFSFSFDLPFKSIFGLENAWVLLWDGFR